MQVDPSTATVSLWLKSINRQELHEQGWIEVNRRFHGIVRAARPFLQAQFPDGEDQQAAFDGMTLALFTIAHFEDIKDLSKLFEQTDETASTETEE